MKSSLLILSLFCISLLSDAASVKSASELIELFKNPSGSVLNFPIEILADLDFSQSGLTLPLGAGPADTCVPYSGVVRGNGHTVRGLVMKNSQTVGYSHAGLFCSLKDATVDNLVFDSSCSFDGSFAGSLSPIIAGSVSVVNVINQAAISGYEGVGGFVGRIMDMNNGGTVSFDGCTNKGGVTGNGYVGGFIGRVPENTGIRLVFSNSNNHGDITAKHYGSGGFVGHTYDSTSTVMNMSKCTNNGHIHGEYYVGGFVGYFTWGKTKTSTLVLSECTNNGIVTGDHILGGFVGKTLNINVDISRSTNNGVVKNSAENYVGGFIGYVDSASSIKISNSTNNGDVLCVGSYAAGFVGYVSAYSYKNNSLTILNSVNTATASVKKGMACGFTCVSPDYSSEVTSNVFNSINRGIVSASDYSYGITNIVTKATNVVSIGGMTFSSESNTFWGNSTKAEWFYGLKGKCLNCPADTTLIRFNSLTNAYEAVENGRRVDTLLNTVAKFEQYGMVWTRNLDLVDA